MTKITVILIILTNIVCCRVLASQSLNCNELLSTNKIILAEKQCFLEYQESLSDNSRQENDKNKYKDKDSIHRRWARSLIKLHSTFLENQIQSQFENQLDHKVNILGEHQGENQTQRTLDRQSERKAKIYLEDSNIYKLTGVNLFNLLTEVRNQVYFNTPKVEAESLFVNQLYIHTITHFQMLGQWNRLAYVSDNHFKFYWSHSDYDRAIEILKNNFLLLNRSYSKEVEIAALHNLFLILENLDNLELAEAVLKRREKLLKGSGDTDSIIDNHISLGLTFGKKGLPALASYYFENAYKLAIDNVDPTAMRGLHLNRSKAYMELNNLSAAADALEKAWRFRDPSGNRLFALYFYQGMLHGYSGRYHEAIEAMNQGLKQSDLPAIWKWEMNFQLARFYRQLGNSALTIDYLQTSIFELETLINNVTYSRVAVISLMGNREPYEMLFEEYYRLKRFEDAISIAEHLKSDSFKLVSKGIASSGNDFDTKNSGLLVDQLSAIDAFIKSVDPKTRSVVYSSSASSEQEKRLEQFAKQSLLPGVGYFHAMNKWYAYGNLTDSTKLDQGMDKKIVVSQLDSIEIENAINNYQVDQGSKQNLEKLGDLLIPGWIDLSQENTLSISPDKALYDISFSALRVKNNPTKNGLTSFLIQQAPIRIVSQLTTLGNQKEKKLQIDGALVIADPDSSLPASRKEALAVNKRIGGHLLLSNKASIKNAQSKSNYNLIHIASHAGTSPFGPWFLFEEGMVDTYRLKPLFSQVDLAVLASCSTQSTYERNKWLTSTGIALSAGAKQVLASLWSIEDKQTGFIIKEFYKGLDQLPPSEALAFAQRQAINQGMPIKDWSGFVLASSGSLH